MKTKADMLCLAVMLSLSAVAAPPAFEPVPKQALVELKATVGKPFTAGLVFIDGKFLAPPYKVERYGTAYRINGQQVTGQVIPWDEFLKTQAGAKVETVQAPSAEAPAAEEPAAPAAGGADEFDDLFDDTPAPRRKASTPPAAKRSAAPAVRATVVFDGQFRPNEKSRALLAKLNKIRTDLELRLRKGGTCFFGTKYSTVDADRGPTDMFLEAMPSVMKDHGSFEAFSSAARAKGITFLPDAVMRDLFRNRLDYVRLQERARKAKEERKWESVLGFR